MKKLLLSLAAVAGFAFAGNAAQVVTQEFKSGLGFPEGTQNAVPTEATEVTATDTSIAYELYGTNVNTTGNYLMMAAKVVEGAYISFSLGFDCETLSLTTTSGCSTNAANAVNIYADGNLIKENLQVNVQSETFNVDIPAEYQSEGTVYKIQSTTTKYNTQFASFTYYEVGAEKPEQPEQPEQPAAPEGTITVAEALQLITDGYTGDATVKGYITSITEISTEYGNATYIISDDTKGSNALTVFRGYYLDGEKFTAEDQLAVGALVVVEGKLVDYNGTPEFTTGSKIIEYNGETSTPEQPEQPGDESTFVTFNFADPASLGYEVADGIGEFDLTGATLTVTPIEIYSEAPEDASNKPRLFLSTGNNPSWTYRFYKDNTVTFSGFNGAMITKVVFVQTNLSNASIEFSDNGTYSNNVWTANSEKGVSSFTITKTATGSNPTITSATVYYLQDSSDSVSSIVVDENAPVEYFNLQGVRVAEPAQGLYIRRQGDKVEKVVIR